MICQMCNKAEATVHLTQVVGGKARKLDLCAACAKKCGVDDPTGFSMIEVLKKLAGIIVSNAEELAGQKEEKPADLTCPVCGYTEADMTKSGRLGCPTCYTVFVEKLESALKTMHRGTRHIGKKPEVIAPQASSALEEKSSKAKGSSSSSRKRSTASGSATPLKAPSKKTKKKSSLLESLPLMQELLESKKELLNQAIEVENYEYAAKIRDEIKELEKKIEKQPSKKQKDDTL